MSNISVWQITEDRNTPINLKDESSLDVITRQLPEGYYSTFRTYAGGTRALGLRAHFQRLYKPVAAPEVDEMFLRRQLSVLLEAYRPDEARIRAVMTRDGQVYLAIAPLALLPREIYERGVRVETTELRREQPRLKSTAFISNSDSERKHIAQEGIFEALLVKDGKILEGMTSNFFYVKYRAPDGHRDRSERSGAKSKREAILCTARAGILLGITRETVIAIAKERGLEINYEPLRRDQIATVSEAFITSSSRGIVPVVRIDNFPIGEGSPGALTQQLHADYEKHVIERAEKI